MRLDELLISGARVLANNAGHGAAWDAGLGEVVTRTVKLARVPSADLTAEQLKRQLGLKDSHIELASAGMRLLDYARRNRPAAVAPAPAYSSEAK